MPRVVIAGLRGGGGKTTLSVGLAAALAGKGLTVTPFKKGPDYIDAGWLASAAGSACYNLDPYLIGEDRVLRSFVEHAAGSDVAVVEGNRGLFDGMDAEGSYSTSRVARIIRSPVLLVVDCTKTTRTTAAMVLGAMRFQRGLKLGGVVLNMLGGRRHESVTREAVERSTGVPVLGAIPRLGDAELPERHMGLTPWQEHPDVTSAISRAADIITEYVDLDGVLQLATGAPQLSLPGPPETASSASQVRIGVIRDSAFQFYYPENLEELRRHGAELLEMSALTERDLPADMDALYIGGGFPETHAIALAKNKSFMRSLRKSIEQGLPVYAECGGLMYLGSSLKLKGRRYAMAGVLPVDFTMHASPRAHGYTEVKVTGKNPFYPRGTVLRGHEFHYSEVTNTELKKPLALTLAVKRGKGILARKDGLCYRNVFATYTHIHALGATRWAEGMVRAARQFKTR
jgi:cobyrinic acid a,c-diamide synthase